MGVHSTQPVVWESHDIKFTVGGPDFEPVITILVDHTDEQAAIAQRASKSLLNAHGFVPVNEAGFQWMASTIRLAWSEARKDCIAARAIQAGTARVAELEHSLADAMEQIAAIQGTNATHMARVAELEAEVVDVALLSQSRVSQLETAQARVEELVDLVEELYPLIGSQYDVPELRERVRTQTEGSRASDIVSAQKSSPMSEAPENDYILAKCDGTWIEVIMEDGEWCSSATPGKRHNPTSWAPLPEDGKPK